MFRRIFISKGRKGNVIVETALVSIVFFALVFGIFDIGQFLFVHQALVNRTRTAIRAGAITGESTSATVNRILYNQTTPQVDGQGNASAGYFGLTSSNVSVTKTGAGTDNARVVVTVTNFPFKMLSLYNHGNFQGTSITVTVPLGMFD